MQSAGSEGIGSLVLLLRPYSIIPKHSNGFSCIQTPHLWITKAVATLSAGVRLWWHLHAVGGVGWPPGHRVLQRSLILLLRPYSIVLEHRSGFSCVQAPHLRTDFDAKTLTLTTLAS